MFSNANFNLGAANASLETSKVCSPHKAQYTQQNTMGLCVWYLFTTILLVGSLALLIAANTAQTIGVSSSILTLTLLVAIPSLLALIIQFIANRRTQNRNVMSKDEETDNNSATLLPKTDTEKMTTLLDTGLRPSPTYISLYFGPALSLFLIVLLRLIASPYNFEGDASTLDFGPKNGEQDGEPNISFTPGFNTVGHTLQGVLAAMLFFPAVSGLLTQLLTCRFKNWWTQCNQHVLNFIFIVAACMTIYPTYNLVKRLIRTPTTFATSSFCNNSFEWACGFVIGVALGNLISVSVKQNVVRKIFNDDDFQKTLDESNGESWVLGTQKPTGYYPKIRGFVVIMGIVLMIAVFVAAVFFGLTWHSCLEGGDECVNYSEDGIAAEVLAVFVIVPTVVIAIVSCGECMRLKS